MICLSGGSNEINSGKSVSAHIPVAVETVAHSTLDCHLYNDSVLRGEKGAFMPYLLLILSVIAAVAAEIATAEITKNHQK